MRLAKALWITASPYLAEHGSESLMGQMVGLSAQRCDTVGAASYTVGDQERWHDIGVAELVTDVQEELADAAAYCAALHQRTGDDRWSQALPLLAQVWALTTGPTTCGPQGEAA